MYQTEMRYYCHNYKTVKVPIPLCGGTSSLRGKAVWEAVRILFQLRSNGYKIYKYTINVQRVRGIRVQIIVINNTPSFFLNKNIMLNRLMPIAE